MSAWWNSFPALATSWNDGKLCFFVHFKAFASRQHFEPISGNCEVAGSLPSGCVIVAPWAVTEWRIQPLREKHDAALVSNSWPDSEEKTVPSTQKINCVLSTRVCLRCRWRRGLKKARSRTPKHTWSVLGFVLLARVEFSASLLPLAEQYSHLC